MNLLEMSRAEALQVLDKVAESCHNGGYTTREQDFFTQQIEDLLERLVLNDIRRRQAALPRLRRDRLGYQAIWGEGTLTPGCQCCLKGRWSQIRSSVECNAACPFCYYYNHHTDFLAPNRFKIGNGTEAYSARDLELFFDLQGHHVDGVAWVYYEPLLQVEKILPVIKMVHEHGLHQWLYTNGLAASPQVLESLAAAGLEEIRFNLAASGCSDKIIERMKIARGLFKNLCLESPMYTDFFNKFMEKRESILATGVEQLNFAELHLNNFNLDSMKAEGALYCFHHGYVSPIKSRQFTYQAMETAERENWPVRINDCSNELKFMRGAAGNDSRLGANSYKAEMLYRMRIWRQAVENFDLWAAAELPDVV